MHSVVILVTFFIIIIISYLDSYSFITNNNFITNYKEECKYLVTKYTGEYQCLKTEYSFINTDIKFNNTYLYHIDQFCTKEYNYKKNDNKEQNYIMNVIVLS